MSRPGDIPAGLVLALDIGIRRQEMRRLGTFVALLALAATPLYAQGRGRYNNSSQGIPPGQLPPPGMCRVWYDGMPPGRQPRATNCNEAERVASRTRNARVIYGSDSYNYRNNDRYNDRGYGNSYPNAYPNRGYGDNGYRGTNRVAYDNGYQKGLEKGREDARDRDSYDPVRYKEYRNADKGYNSRYGSKDQYKLEYRNGFEAGYAQAYRANGGRVPYQR
jgi:hypothetical protein